MILFLPTAGVMTNPNVADAGTSGNYVVSNAYSGTTGFVMQHTSKKVVPTGYDHRRRGFSVRLVTVVSELTERCRFCSCLLRGY